MVDEKLIKNVAIMGASDDRSRFSHKAFEMLRGMGYTPLPISPKLTTINGVKTYKSIADLGQPFHTLTMYVRPSISTTLEDEILAARPDRVIFNPGSENPSLAKALRSQGSHVVEACTLVLLQAGQFDTA